MCITYFVSFLLLGIAFGINWGLNVAKQEMEISTRNNFTADSSMLWGVWIISIIMSFVCTGINVMLTISIWKLSAKEKHITYTRFHLSTSFKLISALFVNTCIIPLLINLGRENWFENSGLVNDVFYNSLSQAFLNPTLYIINVNYFQKKCWQKFEEIKGTNSKMT